MTITSILDAARELGGNAADGYYDEYGVAPSKDGAAKVGNWEDSAWMNAWLELKDQGAEDEDRSACHAAWREGFWI